MDSPVIDTPVYQPQEDSFLLLEEVQKHSRGKVLDMGTGSGIQAVAAAISASEVLAVDINPNALRAAELECKVNKVRNVKFLLSDLFKEVPKDRFDLIIFNPPYLPDEDFEDPALFGGKKGFETLGRFLARAGDYLEEEGKILITSSTLTDRSSVLKIIKDNLLELKTVRKEHYFFEELYIDLIEKSQLLRRLHSEKLNGIMLFDKGKRGLIYKANFCGTTVAIKMKKPESKAVLSLQKEAQFLRRLNRYFIGPKLIKAGKDYIIYRFVDGILFEDWLRSAGKQEIRDIIMNVLHQCRKLDELGINKYEMHHPRKHILIEQGNPVLIDFERSKFSPRPKNVTQFVDYLIGIAQLLKGAVKTDKMSLVKLSRNYKTKPNDKMFRELAQGL